MASRIFRRLADLLDVNVAGVADGDALVYDAGAEEWIPGAGGGGGASALVDLTDVTGTPPATGEAPVWDGDSFELTDVLTAAEAAAGFQPLDSDLTAIAALSTTAFGRGLLILANQAALLSAAGAAAASHAHAGEDITSGTVADARIASTIARDSEVTSAIATHEADTTNVHGIADTSALLDTADIGSSVQAFDSDLGAIAALSPTNDDVIQRKAGAWTNRTIAQLLADLAAPGTTFQPLDSDLTAIAALSTTAFGRSFLALADAAAARALIDLEPGTDIPSLSVFNDHSARHENGGADEISIAGLDGTPTELTNHLNDAADAHDASAISVADVAGDYTATDVEGVLAEIAPQLGGGAGGDPGYYRFFLTMGA